MRFSEEVEQAAMDGEVYCPACDEIVGGMIEPDATDAECPVCGYQCAMGVEQAVLEGFIS